MDKKDLTAENLVKNRFKQYSAELSDIHKKIAAIEEEKIKLTETGKQLTGALNAMQDILKDVNDASIVIGMEECTETKPSSA